MVNVLIKTWGCTANQDNEAIMAGLLIQSGNSIVKADGEADVVVFNTCTVKGVTQNKIVADLTLFKEKFPKKKILISGCMAGAQEEMLKKLNPNVSLMNTMHVTEVNEIVERVMRGEVVTLTKQRYENKTNLPKVYSDGIATIQISQGCADACYFCITKLSQGFVKSFPLEDIKKEIENAVKRGIKTVYLTSQDNGAYGLDKEKQSQLVNLLKELIKVEGDFKLRAGMINPRHIVPIKEELVKVFKNEKIMKFIHLPVQAGSEKVIKEMNRKHSIEEFREIINLFRKEIPSISIATDIICGYPSETEEDFLETLKLIKEIRPEVINVSQFAARPGTVASRLKPLQSQIVKERTKRLSEIVKEYQGE
ncbi:MAG: tRNA (N(6)-L-threonylcarbamoyladenosine(37)-C(2))-methylthiotransferase [Candidatus Nanoarchaeia archaeon]